MFMKPGAYGARTSVVSDYAKYLSVASARISRSWKGPQQTGANLRYILVHAHHRVTLHEPARVKGARFDVVDAPPIFHREPPIGSDA